MLSLMSTHVHKNCTEDTDEVDHGLWMIRECSLGSSVFKQQNLVALLPAELCHILGVHNTIFSDDSFVPMLIPGEEVCTHHLASIQCVCPFLILKSDIDAFNRSITESGSSGHV